MIWHAITTYILHMCVLDRKDWYVAETGQVLLTRHCRTAVPQVVTLIAGSERRRSLMAGDDDEMFMTRSLNVTPKTTEQRILIARSDKSVAYT